MFGLKKSNLEKLKDFIRKTDNQLTKEDKEKLINLIKPAIGIVTKKLQQDNLKVGSSKIGGLPDMPKDMKWPEINNVPLIFCAQYNLSEFKKYDSKNVLPKKGIFYLFIGLDEDSNEFYFSEKKCKVIFVENIENLEKKECPTSLNVNQKIEPAKIEYFDYLTLPDDENYKLFYFDEKYDDFYFYCYQDTDAFINEELYNQYDSMHQIIGEDRSIQSSVVYDFARVETNIKIDKEYTENWNEILEKSKSYTILLQLDCMDSRTNLDKFGGTGVFYIGIKTEALEKRDFEHLFVSFQTT